MTEWEQHFQKLQYGLIFDENNPDVIESSEKKNCNKKLIQNDIGSSQDKSYNKYERHSLDEYIKNMVKKLRAVPKHLNINNKKRWTFNLIYKKKTKHLIQKYKTKKIARACACAFAAKNIFGIRIRKTSLAMDLGQNVTIAKNIMNYV